MPPRKRARHSRNTTATASPSPDSPSAAQSSPTNNPAEEDAARDSSPEEEEGEEDLWTDAEETALFRALLRYKPTGIHKHHRMLALHAWLLENHHIHPRNEHTRPPGIWRKLEALYDLKALDAREDARQLEGIPGVEEGVVLDGEWSEVEGLVEVGEFGLPVSEDETVRKEVWGRRLRNGKDEEESESEVEMPELNLRKTPPRVLDLRTGVEPSPQGKRGRGGVKGRKGKETEEGRRGSLAQAPSRRSARQAESTADEHSVDGKQDEEAEGEEEEEEIEDSEDKESRASTPATRSTRSKGGAAAKGGTKAKGRGRAKAK